MQQIENIVFIGAGNLATQLALAFTQKGLRVQQVYSRTPERAKALAQKVNAHSTSELSQLVSGADLYVVAVKDSAIEEVLQSLTLDQGSLVVHTAGSIPMKVLHGFTRRYGVFYPLQTFSVNRGADFLDIPICIEASDGRVMDLLEKLAQRISSSVHPVSSDKRKTLHLAAVFVNNFVNHLYVIGSEILNDKALDFNLLRPLIRETALKVQTMHPLQAQTGPAKRMDQQVIEDHIQMLENQPEFQKIYSLVTQSIYHIHQKQNDDLL